MQLFVESAGLLGPGLGGWRASRAILIGAQPSMYGEVLLPQLEALPATERRRTGLSVKLALGAGLDALAHSPRRSEALASVFTSSTGDGQVIHDICQALTSAERYVSPTRFHNSVHNAAAGYWSIALRSNAPSISLCCHDWSFAAGLLEAAAQCLTSGLPVLLVSYDLPYPEPMCGLRPILGVLGAALLLAPEAGPEAFARIDLRVEAGLAAPAPMQDQGLEKLRAGNPTGRALPLLQVLAGPTAGAVGLEYVGGNTLMIEAAPEGERRS